MAHPLFFGDMTVRHFILALALGSFAFPAAGQNSNDKSNNPLADDEVENSRVICKKQDVTGSFVKRRKVCRTKAEWDRLAQHSQSEANEYADHGRGGSRGN